MTVVRLPPMAFTCPPILWMTALRQKRSVVSGHVGNA